MTDSEFDTICKLITASTQGDSQAKDDLFGQVKDFLQLMADKHLDGNLRHKVAPSDIVQQTFCNAVRNLDNFRGSSAAEFHGWLKVIVVNEVKNARRDLHAAKRDVSREKAIETDRSRIGDWKYPTDDTPTPSSHALAEEQVENFYVILNQLSPDYSQVIQLRSIDQLSFKDISDKMGRTENAVSKLWYRAVVSFENLLKESEAFKSRAQSQSPNDSG